jgi:hypothetical protein
VGQRTRGIGSGRGGSDLSDVSQHLAEFRPAPQRRARPTRCAVEHEQRSGEAVAPLLHPSRPEHVVHLLQRPTTRGTRAYLGLGASQELASTAGRRVLLAAHWRARVVSGDVPVGEGKQDCGDLCDRASVGPPCCRFTPGAVTPARLPLRPRLDNASAGAMLLLRRRAPVSGDWLSSSDPKLRHEARQDLVGERPRPRPP